MSWHIAVQMTSLETAHNLVRLYQTDKKKLFNRIIKQFRSTIPNKPKSLLDSLVSRRGRIEHHYVVVGAIRCFVRHFPGLDFLHV